MELLRRNLTDCSRVQNGGAHGLTRHRNRGESGFESHGVSNELDSAGDPSSTASFLPDPLRIPGDQLGIVDRFEYGFRFPFRKSCY